MNESEAAAYNYLTLIQKSVYDKLGTTPNWGVFLDKNYHKLLCKRLYTTLRNKGESFKKFEKRTYEFTVNNSKNSKLPYQNPSWNRLIFDLNEEIENVLKEYQIQCHPRPIFGSIFTGEINAMALSVPKSSHCIILFHEGIFIFANIIVKIFCLLFKVTDAGSIMTSYSFDDNHWKNEIESNKDIVNNLLNLISTSLLSG